MSEKKPQRWVASENGKNFVVSSDKNKLPANATPAPIVAGDISKFRRIVKKYGGTVVVLAIIVVLLYVLH